MNFFYRPKSIKGQEKSTTKVVLFSTWYVIERFLL